MKENFPENNNNNRVAPFLTQGGPRTMTLGTGMRWLFTLSAMLTIVALGLIIFSLIKESSGFFSKYNESLSHHRLSGLEYVDMLEARHSKYIEIDHKLTELRSSWIDSFQKSETGSEDLKEQIYQPGIDALFSGYRETVFDLRQWIDRQISLAIQYRDELRNGLVPDAERIDAIIGKKEEYRSILNTLEANATALFEQASGFDFGNASLNRKLSKIATAHSQLHDSLETHLATIQVWSAVEPVRTSAAVVAFITGQKWVTASDQQNQFGLLPLLSGSLLVSAIALAIAIPFGVGAAIYVNQVASPPEQAFIKPFIEFISALPSVVVGFFGVVVFGEFVREVSRIEILEWLPFFPIQERLNAFTAGALLGLMAVPTIFSLTEDALNGVAEHLKEASYAIGATRLQTTWRTIIPSAMPGIIAAILLGFGRVIGETMVVLICAGNRVKIPDMSEGMRAVFEPVHSMTGMIAQEMGEVVYGSLHYHALFMVGLVLFTISLFVNYTAQTMARRHLQPADSNR